MCSGVVALPVHIVSGKNHFARLAFGVSRKRQNASPGLVGREVLPGMDWLGFNGNLAFGS